MVSGIVHELSDEPVLLWLHMDDCIGVNAQTARRDINTESRVRELHNHFSEKGIHRLIRRSTARSPRKCTNHDDLITYPYIKSSMLSSTA